MVPRPSQADSPRASQICAGRFAAPAGRIVARPAGLRDWTLVYSARGRGRYCRLDLPGEALVARPGQLILVPPGVPHWVEALPGGWDHLWTHFLPRPHWQDWLTWPAASGGWRTVFVPAGAMRRRIVSAFRAVVRLTTGPVQDREAFALHALEELLLWCQRLPDAHGRLRPDARLRDCLDYLDRHLAERVTLQDLARVSGQSVSRITHRFRQLAGLTPMQYLEQRRLERAMELLTHTAMSVKEVAAQVGFENPFYFTTRFHKHTGYSPRSFRQRAQCPARPLRRPGVPLNPTDRELVGQPS